MGGHYDKIAYNDYVDLHNQFEKLKSVVDELKSEVKYLRKENEWLTKENQRLGEKVSVLEEKNKVLLSENNKLKKENKLFKDEVERLKSNSNNNSSNSSLPPSSDQKPAKKANEYNSREKTGRRSGGQKGSKGKTLTKADVEAKLKKYDCIHEIKEMGSPAKGADPKVYTSRYVLDLETKLKITELRFYPDENGKYHIPMSNNSEVIYGPELEAMITMLYSQGVVANDRIAEFLNQISNDALEISTGSVYNICKKAGSLSLPIKEELGNSPLNQPVINTDSTEVSVNGVQSFIRNFSSKDAVIYEAMSSKKLKELKEVDFLKHYAGILIHDHESSLYHFGIDHGECNVHLMRYLTKNNEDAGNSWSEKMIKLLNEMNENRKEAIISGRPAFTEVEIKEYEDRYRKLIDEGYKENENTAHKYARKEEKALLNRMKKYMCNHLLFLHDFRVDFHNNRSERDLRKVKNRQKMAGGFRTSGGHGMYCAIMSVIETLKRRNMPILDNLKKLFTDGTIVFA